MALSRRLPGRAEENYEKSQSVWWIRWPWLETDAFGMHATSVPTCSANAVSIYRFFHHIRSSVRVLGWSPACSSPICRLFPNQNILF